MGDARKLLGIVFAAAVTAGVLAGPAAGEEAENRVRDPALAGVASLDELLARVRAQFPGRVLEVEIEDEEKGAEVGPVYEVKVLTQDGHVLKLEYDATTLELLEAKGRRSRERENDD